MSPLDTARLIITAIVVLGFGGVLIAWIIYPPHETSNLMSALVSTVGAGYLLVLNYWFTGNRS